MLAVCRQRRHDGCTIVSRCDVHTLTVPCNLITFQEIARLQGELHDAARASEPAISIDLSAVEEFTNDGLSALIELLARRGPIEISLVGLRKRLMKSAMETDLAELATLYPKVLTEPPEGKRWAVIYEEEPLFGIGWTDIAGRPLLVRQLQWLRECGVEDVIVEVCSGAHSHARGRFLLSDEPLVSRVVVLPTNGAKGPSELARRAGLAKECMRIEIAASTLCAGSIAPLLSAPEAMSLRFSSNIAPRALAAIIGVANDVTRDPEARPQQVSEADGWGTRIDSIELAQTVGCAALAGTVSGLMIHASQAAHTPQIWLARGAHVETGAKLEPPVYLGANALVLAGAHVGPCAIIGDGTVVEQGAVVSHGSVAANTIVGEGVRIRYAYADQLGVVEFSDEKRISIVDDLVLAPRRAASTAFSARAFAALLLLVLLVPWLIGGLYAMVRGISCWRTIERRDGRRWHVGILGWRGIDAFPALCDVLLGTRDLIGVAASDALDIAARRRDLLLELRAGALDVSRALSPQGRRDTLMRMWRWYARHKRADLDRALLKARETRAASPKMPL
jgi:hypothetical protein